MADHSVARSIHATLTADVADAVTLTEDHPNAEVKNRGAVAIYATTNGSVPEVGGDDTYIVPAGESVVLVLSTRPNVRDVVKLIAEDACAYSVTGVSRDYERSGGGSGAVSEGGGGGAVTVANGADVAQGSTTDAAATGDGTVVAILKRLRTLLNGGLPAALGAGGGVKIDGSGTAVPVSGTVGVTGVSTEATLDARTGALTETAPGTDTASAGINGRLQRVAQRLSSLIALLPTALGAGGGLKVDGSGTALPVSGTVTASDGGGSLTVDGTVAVTDGGGSLTVDGTVAVTGVATEATLDARTGSLTETAPASDTASSGINGRLQRIAQRLTSLIALLPASLAAGGGLKVEGVSGGVAQPVTFPAYTAPVSGELQGSTSALQLPTVTCKLVMFVAQAANAGKVYLGVSGVTKIDGTTDTTTGFELSAGQATPWIPVDNLNRLYRICDNAGDDLTYLVMN